LILLQSLAGLGAFASYVAVASGLCVLYLFAYTRATGHDEFALIARGNVASALALGASLLGFVAPLASAILHTVGLLDCAIWGFIALLTQLIAYGLARLTRPGLSAAIAAGDVAAAIWLASLSLAAGAISAASMSM
jgi:putative membrane protein